MGFAAAEYRAWRERLAQQREATERRWRDWISEARAIWPQVLRTADELFYAKFVGNDTGAISKLSIAYSYELNRFRAVIRDGELRRRVGVLMDADSEHLEALKRWHESLTAELGEDIGARTRSELEDAVKGTIGEVGMQSVIDAEGAIWARFDELERFGSAAAEQPPTQALAPPYYTLPRR